MEWYRRPTADDPTLDELHRRRAESAKWTQYPSDVVPAWVADMDFAPPRAARDALVALVERGDLGYAAEATAESYLEAYRAWAWQRFGHRPDRLHTLAGVLPGLALALEALSSPGDVIALPVPAYPRFAPVIAGVDRRPAQFPLTEQEDRYVLDPERLHAFLVETTAKVLVWCNPQNPTGRVFRAEEQLAVADACQRAGTLVVSDEIHQDLVIGSARHVPFSSLDHDVAAKAVVLSSPTKTFNLAGLRVAQIELPRDPAVRALVEAQLTRSLHHPSLPGLVAARGAYHGATDWLADVLSTVATNVDTVIKAIGDQVHFVRPQGTYLLWGRIEGLGELSAARFLLERAGVAVEDGDRFLPGAKEWFRLNIACHDTTLSTIIERMEHALEDLR